MRLLGGLLVVAVSAVLTAGPVSAAPSRDALIRPGVGIGKIKLGMTYAQVRQALGAPTVVNARRKLGFGSEFVEYDWDWGEWTVEFVKQRVGAVKVVRITTRVRTERTRERVGLGTRMPVVRDRLRRQGVRCTSERLPEYDLKPPLLFACTITRRTTRTMFYPDITCAIALTPPMRCAYSNIRIVVAAVVVEVRGAPTRFSRQ